MPNSTQVCGRMRSTLRRVILPVVNAWPAITVGVSHNTVVTFCAASWRRSRVPKSVNWPFVGVALTRWQKLSSPPAYSFTSAGSLSRNLVEEAVEAAEMIVMAMADDQCVEL